jgi:hypothetical protein
VLIKVQLPTIIKLPTMAFSNPPPSEPGAGVLCVNMARFNAENPLNISMLKIQSRKISPMTMATMDKKIPMLLLILRLR